MQNLKTTVNKTEFLDALKGDGRKHVPFLVALPKVQHNTSAKKWREILVDTANKRRIITSPSGLTAAIICSYCEAKNIDYDLRARNTYAREFQYYKVLFDMNALIECLKEDGIIKRWT